MMDLEQAQQRAARLAAALVRWSQGRFPADLGPALTAEGRMVLDAIDRHGEATARRLLRRELEAS